MSYPMVRVEWIDTQAQGGWHQAHEAIANLAKLSIHSVGYLIHDAEDGVVIVQGFNRADEATVHDSLSIPRTNVIDVTRLRR